MAAEIFQLLNMFFLLHLGCPIYDEEIMRACFFKSDSRLRTNEAKFTVKDIDFTLCTHYVYGYAKVDPGGKTVKAAGGAEEDGPNGLFKEFNAGKKINPWMKTILAVGGEEPSDDVAFENLYRADMSFQTFAQNTVTYAKEHEFNGIHIHWQVINNDMGKIAMTILLKEIRAMIDQDAASQRLLLSIVGFPRDPFISSRHNVTEIRKYVDYVFVSIKVLITLNTATFIGALFYGGLHQYSAGNINDSIHAWKNHGMPYNKLVMSLTVLGHYIRLRYASEYFPYSTGTTDVLRGNKYNLENRLAFPEICEMMNTSRVYYESIVKNPYLVKGDEWVGYLDVVSIRERIDYVRQFGLAGIQLANLDEDDFSGTACNAGRFPLVTAMRDKLDPRPVTTVSTAATTPNTWTTSNIGTASEIEVALEESTDHEMSNTSPPKGMQKITTSKPGAAQRESTKTLVFRYLVYILLFTVAHILGHVFMNFLRKKSKGNEQKTGNKVKEEKHKENKPGGDESESDANFPVTKVAISKNKPRLESAASETEISEA